MLSDTENNARKLTVTSGLPRFAGCCLAGCLLLLLLSVGSVAAESTAPETLSGGGEIVSNPQATYAFAGWNQLGKALGLSEDWGVRLGGFFIPEFNWIASGGTRPDSTFVNTALGLHAIVDASKALSIPGGTFGVEFLEFAGGAVDKAAGSVQQFTTMDGAAPRNRQELMQLWWRQVLFDNRLIFQIGKMNGPGIFGTVQAPVIIDNPRLQDGDITNLLFVPVGLNPTLFGRLPSYYNTGYGAVVHFAPTNWLYFSYGIFDANGIRGVQTGIDCLPTLNGYALHIGELGYSWRVGEEKKPGRFGVGVWRQTGELYTPALTQENGADGYYFFANQRLWYLHPDEDNAGIIGWFNFGHTGADTQAVKTYVGAGLTGLRLVPGRPADQFSIGIASSRLNDMPGAGAFFYPDVESRSADLRDSEFMFQAVYQTTLFFKMPGGRGFWSLTPVFGYTFIPNPGERPDLPAAHVLSVRLVTLF